MNHPFRETLLARARGLHRTIAFPDAGDERMIRAARILARDTIVKPVLVGSRDQVDAGEPALELHDPRTSPLAKQFTEELVRLRRNKGMTETQARELMLDPLYYAAMMVRQEIAHGAVAGSLSTTAAVLRAGLQVVGMSESVGVVSSFFLMLFPEQIYSFADCGVIPRPTPDQLADIAVCTAEHHRILTGEEPRVAMLSFSTLGSAEDESVLAVREATRIASGRKPSMLIDGELQLDAAIDPSVAARKAPGSRVAGSANVLIFPNLDAGNIAYKMAERMGGAQAIGPLVQGLKRPIFDLSRGCSVDDIVLNAAINAIIGASNG